MVVALRPVFNIASRILSTAVRPTRALAAMEKEQISPDVVDKIPAETVKVLLHTVFTNEFKSLIIEVCT